MFPIAKFVCLVVVFLFVFTTNFDSAMLIRPFDPPTAEAKKKEKKEKKDKKQKKDEGKDEERDKDRAKDNDKGKDKD